MEDFSSFVSASRVGAAAAASGASDGKTFPACARRLFRSRWGRGRELRWVPGKEGDPSRIVCV